MILYSSNLEDMVFDFFLDSFSTAKVAKGLGRRACGFEINKNAFDYQIKEIEKIQSGEYLSKLRQVPENKFVNKGKPLTQEETNQIVLEFNNLIRKGYSKKLACDNISDKYGRGYWSVLNIVSNNNQDKNKYKATSLFDKIDAQ
jgi:site-specific DNA-methyltransferase (adenine-specific)